MRINVLEFIDLCVRVKYAEKSCDYLCKPLMLVSTQWLWVHGHSEAGVSVSEVSGMVSAVG